MLTLADWTQISYACFTITGSFISLFGCWLTRNIQSQSSKCAAEPAQPDVIIIISIIIIIKALLMLIIVADAGVKNSSAHIWADFFSTSSSHQRLWANEHAACLLCKDLIVLLIGCLKARRKNTVWCQRQDSYSGTLVFWCCWFN